MDQSTNVRPACLEDLPYIFELANQLSDSIMVSEQYLADSLEDYINNEQHLLYVLTEHDTVVGYLSGYCRNAIYAGGKVAYIDEIVVNAQNRGMQLGSTLMAEFEDLCRQRGCKLVSLATYGAKDFYEKLGYYSKASYYKKYLN
jgi:ribosomal protein S18 acetylase RimI-like enzyme